MKKNISKICLCILVLSVVFVNSIFASTKIEERTEDNLKIWDSFSVTSTLKEAALKTPKVDEKEKIYDFAELLTDEEEKALYEDIQDYIENSSMDMVVVTIKDNNKYSSMEYADDFYDYNYFGIGKTRDGILLLIDMDTRNVWISTTGNAMLYYSDARIDTMLDYVAPNLTSQNYKLAVSQFIYYANDYYKKGIPSSNANYYIDENGNMQKTKEARYKEALVPALIVSGIITLIAILIGVSGHRNVKKAGTASYYLVKDSVVISDRRDVFLHSNTSKVRISSESSGGGGSSSHSSSSGSSHGGCGRGF